ncbi:hypothetical protein M413DRAFT_252511 [Hebeloma cylindrosporum]|uniref:DNA polymerase n=1 Tax=Hebeloma cylindrosporum TaxID=76867 RepID=A0A0C2YA41_HEBCY|nr:hypothetical protein M413DRAFT_252511 [Hebeloma cylindrosporum h7]
MPEYNPNVTTHIITDAPEGTTLRALGVKRLKDIPEHIPTLKWSWVVSGINHKNSLSKEEFDARLDGDILFLHAAFHERMDAGRKPQPIAAPSFRKKGKERAAEQNRGDGPSHGVASTSAATQDVPALFSESEGDVPAHSSRPFGALISPPTSPRRSPVHGQSSKENNHDPLAEFYPQAHKQRQQEDEWSSLGDLDADASEDVGTDSDAGDPEPHPPAPRQKRGWTCDKKEVQAKGDCPNQDIIDKLTQLMELHKAKMGDDDHWRAFSYSKSIRALRNYPRRIKTYEEARGIRGVGEKTAKKIEEILQTGDLQRIKYEKTKDVEVTRLFQGIYGVGQSIAFKWYSAGCRTLDDLRAGKGGVKLSPVQEIGLQYYDDLNDRMPRAEAKAIFELIKPIALSIDPKLYIEIMGSYRRGKADCGDIDILITRPVDDGNTHRGVLPCLLQKLHAADIITEDLALPEDPDDLEAIYRGLCHVPDVKGSKRRRIDFLSVPWTARGAALLYYTGDDIFNRAIRMKANVLGYSLNQKGLFGNIVRDPRDRRIKMNAGVLVASETEEEIFKILGVPWQEPHERVRG